jgi:purine-cytosine permease-like protein
VFNRRQRGGRYWFNHGWNWRGLGAWLVSAALSICFVNLPGQFIGPLGNLANGIDLSIPIGIGLAAVLYPLLVLAFPEPADAFGPDGPRVVPAGPAANTPIVSEDAGPIGPSAEEVPA